MEVEFSDDDYGRLETDPGFTGGFAQNIVSSFRRRMQQIRAAVDERDLRNLRGLNFKKMKPPRSHQQSIKLNKQWRLILELNGNGEKYLVIICIEDYH